MMKRLAAIITALAFATIIAISGCEQGGQQGGQTPGSTPTQTAPTGT